MQRYGFVLGTGRCGSTLVQEVLSRHADAGFTSNLDDRFGLATGRGQVAAYKFAPQAATTKGRARFAPSEAYRALTREVSPQVVQPSRPLLEQDATPWLAARLHDFFATRAARQRKPVFLHKFVGVSRAGLVAAALPDVRFLHVVRDGRAVASSWLQMPWWRGQLGPGRWHFGPLRPDLDAIWQAGGRSHVLLAGLAWWQLVDQHRDAAALLPAERWLDLRYEDLLLDPAGELRRAAEFLGLPWTPAYAQTVAGTKFEPPRPGAYVGRLGAAHAAELTSVLAEPLERYGYLG